MRFRNLATTAFLLLLARSPVSAQAWVEPFAATELSSTSLQNESRLFLGARGGWNINRRYWFGGSIYTLLPKSLLSGVVVSRRDSLNVLYAGPTFGYTIWRTGLFELSAHVVVGLGGLGIRFRDPQLEARRYDTFLVVQPEINLLINAARSFRLFTGGSYRYVKGITTVGFSDDLLSQPSAFLGILFSL